jgi:hypothetical protein
MDHFYREIPGWFSFRALYQQAVREARDGAHFVEVGSWKGRSAAFMAVEILRSQKKIRFDCIDTWKGSDEPKHRSDPDVRAGTLFSTFLRNIAPIRSHLNVIRQPSVSAAAEYSDLSLDFVFIDAAHDYQSVKNDIAAWWPKVRVGGALAGDDYNKREVAKAVRDSFLEHEMVQGTGSGQQWRKIRGAEGC